MVFSFLCALLSLPYCSTGTDEIYDFLCQMLSGTKSLYPKFIA